MRKLIEMKLRVEGISKEEWGQTLKQNEWSEAIEAISIGILAKSEGVNVEEMSDQEFYDRYADRVKVVYVTCEDDSILIEAVPSEESEE